MRALEPASRVGLWDVSAPPAVSCGGLQMLCRFAWTAGPPGSVQTSENLTVGVEVLKPKISGCGLFPETIELTSVSWSLGEPQIAPPSLPAPASTRLPTTV